ncbi:MAG: SpoIIE family protein phosphatase [Cyanobacteriota bacterium]|nr:SpoIIE family protein phosphatase [Cyanobacteriota bacterium]
MDSNSSISLKTILVTPFALLLLATVSLVGYFSYRNGQESINRLSEALLDETNERVALNLREYIALPHHINHLNAQAIELGQLDLENMRQLELYFLQQVQMFPKISFVGVGLENKHNLGSERYDDGQLTLRVSTEETQFVFYTYATDVRGQYLKVLHQIPFDPRTRPWYQAAVSAKRATWGPIYPNTAGVTSYLGATLPFYDQNQQLRGVLLSNFSLTSISNYLNNLKLSKTGLAFVIERSGGLVATSTGEKPFLSQRKDYGAERVLVTESQHPLTKTIANLLYDRYGGFELVAIPTFERLNIENQTYFVKIQPFRDEYGLDWLIVTTLPESDFATEINLNNRNTIMLCGVSLMIAMITALAMARWLTRPIDQLTIASEKMAQGNFDQTVAQSKIWELNKLAIAFNSMSSQLQEFFSTLELRVAERTQELAVANQAISHLNEQLQKENLKMSAELDIIKRMQQMILPKPKELEIKGLDIAGFMQPAEVVGGDYYDVLYGDEVTTISIGDVTGHGLESGILMLMTQTAVRTLKEMQEYDSIKFLDALNRTIYKNVQRMNTDKNLTLALLNYFEGKVTISGQHEETIIIRQGGKIELVDTINLGFPIGMDSHIADFISHQLIELDINEGIVLFTDGITEAENRQKEFYGIERLCRVIRDNWERSAEAIKEAVIEDLRHHIGDQTVYDDITLLVFKRK